METYSRDPCPWGIFKDCGSGFIIGLIGGSVFQCIKGFKNAPAGFKHRFASSISSIKTRSPVIAGSFGAYGGMFAVIECSLIQIRKKEDPWNIIISGVATGGILTARKGLPLMAISALSAGVVISLMEGANILLARIDADEYKPLVKYPSQMDQRRVQETLI